VGRLESNRKTFNPPRGIEVLSKVTGDYFGKGRRLTNVQKERVEQANQPATGGKIPSSKGSSWGRVEIQQDYGDVMGADQKGWRKHVHLETKAWKNPLRTVGGPKKKKNGVMPGGVKEKLKRGQERICLR